MTKKQTKKTTLSAVTFLITYLFAIVVYKDPYLPKGMSSIIYVQNFLWWLPLTILWLSWNKASKGFCKHTIIKTTFATTSNPTTEKALSNLTEDTSQANKFYIKKLITSLIPCKIQLKHMKVYILICVVSGKGNTRANNYYLDIYNKYRILSSY